MQRGDGCRKALCAIAFQHFTAKRDFPGVFAGFDLPVPVIEREAQGIVVIIFLMGIFRDALEGKARGLRLAVEPQPDGARGKQGRLIEREEMPIGFCGEVLAERIRNFAQMGFPIVAAIG
jgi:hypothetical protein